MPDDTREFHALTREFYQVWLRFHPVAAVDAGVPGYETLLPAIHDDEFGALASWLESLMSGLEGISPASLDEDLRLDMRLLRGAATVEHHALGEQDWRYRDPVRFLPVRAIRQLVLHPSRMLRTALSERLSHIPEYLRQARSHLTTAPELVPPELIEAALGQGETGVDHLSQLRDGPLVKLTFTDQTGIRALFDAAIAGLRGYLRFVETELAPQAEGTIGCGRAHFDRILRKRHFLSLNADGVSRLARQVFDTLLRELSELCREITGTDDVGGLIERLEAEQTSGDLLGFYRQELARIGDFVHANDFVSLTDEHPLNLLETPDCLRSQIRGVAYNPPSPLDGGEAAFLYVNPLGHPNNPHSPAAILRRCLRECCPGRHLATTHAARHPAARTLPRRLDRSTTLTDGWAAYGMRLMLDQGYCALPEQRFSLLAELLRYPQRALLDVEINTNGISPERAYARAPSIPGMAPERLQRHLILHAGAAGQWVGYLMGWVLIEAARDAAFQAQPELKLRDFHDRLLAHGPIAAPLAIGRAFGPAVLEAAEQTVRERAGPV